MSGSYPRTGDGGGSGEVAYGRRLDLSTAGLPGFRFPIGGNSGVPATYYEVFYDVYLKNVSGSTYNYVFRYWYAPVELKTDGPLAPNPGQQRWYLKPGGRPKEISVPQGPGITTLTSIPGLGISLPSLPLVGTTRPATSIVWTPTQFGWRGSGQGTSVGTPGTGGFGKPFVTRNPFGYSGAGQADGGEGDDAPGSSGNEDPAATTDDDPYRSEGPPIPGFDKTRKTRFNPPPVITLTGAYVPVVYDWEGNAISVDETESDTRQSLLGRGSYNDRVLNKATIIQWIKFQDEWRVKQGGQVTNAKGQTTDSWTTDQPLVPNGVRYGFRFTYNPSEVAFQMSPIPGIDPGVIISGIGRSFPMGDEDGGSIQISTYLNRIEDMAFLKPVGKNKWDFAGVNPYGGRKIEDWHKKGIATRGTGYDLEYLFRTTLGKPYNTKTRGVTADIGLILGLPLLLKLGGGMTYTGRLTGLSYTHMYFTADMVPTFTQVTMSFTRFPDATSFNETPQPGGSGNDNKPKKKKGRGSGNSNTGGAGPDGTR